MQKSGSRTIALEKIAPPPNHKINANPNPNPNQGYNFPAGQLSGCPPNPKTNPNLDPNPKLNRVAIFVGGQLCRYHKKQSMDALRVDGSCVTETIIALCLPSFIQKGVSGIKQKK